MKKLLPEEPIESVADRIRAKCPNMDVVILPYREFANIDKVLHARHRTCFEWYKTLTIDNCIILSDYNNGE